MGSSPPRVIKCHRHGRWRAWGVMPYGTILCDDCYVSILLAAAARKDAAALERLGDS